MNVVELKAPSWGLTAAGAALGLTMGPAGVVVLATVGAALDALRSSHRKSWQRMNTLDEHRLRAVRPLAPHLPDEVLQYKAAVSRPNGPAAMLHNFLHRHVDKRVKGDKFWKHDKTRGVVASFQQAFNRDRGMRVGSAPLPEDGIFDARTAGALALYTKVPVSPDPNPDGGEA